MQCIKYRLLHLLLIIHIASYIIYSYNNHNIIVYSKHSLNVKARIACILKLIFIVCIIVADSMIALTIAIIIGLQFILT